MYRSCKNPPRALRESHTNLFRTAVKPAVQLLQIQEVHPGPHSQCMQFFFAVFIYFFIPVLSKLSFTFRTPNKDQKIEQLFFLFKSYNPETLMSSAVNGLCMLYASAHKKCLAQKVGHLGSLGPIPIIQPPVSSSCVAL